MGAGTAFNNSVQNTNQRQTATALAVMANQTDRDRLRQQAEREVQAELFAASEAEKQRAFQAAQGDIARTAAEHLSAKEAFERYLAPLEGTYQAKARAAVGDDVLHWDQHVADLGKDTTVTIQPGDPGYVPAVNAAQKFVDAYTPTPGQQSLDWPQQMADAMVPKPEPQTKVIPGVQPLTKMDVQLKQMEDKARQVGQALVSKDLRDLQGNFLDTLVGNPQVLRDWLEAHNQHRLDADPNAKALSVDEFKELELGPAMKARVAESKARVQDIADRGVRAAAELKYEYARLNEIKRHNVSSEQSAADRLAETKNYHNFLRGKAEQQADADLRSEKYKIEDLIQGYQKIIAQPDGDKEAKAFAAAYVKRLQGRLGQFVPQGTQPSAGGAAKPQSLAAKDALHEVLAYLDGTDPATAKQIRNARASNVASETIISQSAKVQSVLGKLGYQVK